MIFDKNEFHESSHHCLALECIISISLNSIMCTQHWGMVPSIYQRPIMSHYNVNVADAYQSDKFWQFVRRARISILCQENSCATIELLPDIALLDDAEKAALTTIVNRYRHANQ